MKLNEIASGLPNGWSMNEEGTIDVQGDVTNAQSKMYMPSPGFGKVGGYFNCKYNKLSSLAGAPKSVGRSFDCSYNQLTSLVGAPSSVGKHFDCSYNQLTSLVGAPSSVGMHFDCSDNKLTPIAILDLIDINCVSVSFRQDVDRIINKYLKSKDKLSYQEELLDAGLI